MLYGWLSILTFKKEWIIHGQWHTQSSAETINSRAELGHSSIITIIDIKVTQPKIELSIFINIPQMVRLTDV